MALRESTVLYRALIDQLADRIAYLGLTMWQVDDLSGVPDGYTAKALHPDTPSGRQATWPQIQLIIDALYPDGFAFVVIPRAPKRRPYRRQSPLGLDKLPPHPASVRPKRRRKAESIVVPSNVVSFAPRPPVARRAASPSRGEGCRAMAV